ncbi:MAG: AMP-binding protein, partial [bacterium]|nr:AMP-binding protein [bacterium]
RMTRHFRVLLEGILDNPAQSLSLLPLLTKDEQYQLVDWNQTETDYPINKTVVDLFRARVEKTPENIAVVFEEQAFSYKALNTKANQLVHNLTALGVGSETIVGICARRSPELVTGLLGILKAGGTYVPLDPDYPLSRLQFILEDSSASVVLTESHLLERLPVPSAKVICLDSNFSGETFNGSGLNPVKRLP